MKTEIVMPLATIAPEAQQNEQSQRLRHIEKLRYVVRVYAENHPQSVDKLKELGFLAGAA